jgi:hypothetical protein
MELSPQLYRPMLALLGVVVLGFMAYKMTAPAATTARPSAGEVDGARFRLDPAAARAAGAQYLTPALRRATFHFGPSEAPADRQVFLDAVASARPEARRLIGLVDGLVSVHFGPTGVPFAIGLTVSGDSETYGMTIDLGQITRRYGPRGIDRTVLHELGHVVDMALVTNDVMARMDAEIPRGLGCEAGKLGGCAVREERFAETFAKWALGDIGVNLDIGYKVPPPTPPLAVWGEPLSQLAAG